MAFPVVRRSSPVLRWAVIAVSIFLVLLFCVTAAMRVHSPAELEQHEGYMTMTVHHLWHGGSLYPKPNFEFLANMYPPVYYYASLAMAKLMGAPDLAALRAVSILTTLGAFALIALLVWLEQRRWLAAVVGMALYAGAYRICEGWFDIGRLDSFYVFVVLLAILCTRKLPIVIAALVWVVAVQTKQPILPVAVLVLMHDYKNLKRTFAGLATFFVGLAASVALLNHASGGWYKLYIFIEPKANAGMILRPGVLFWPQNIFGPFAIACFIIAAAFILIPAHWVSVRTRFYASTLSIVLLTWYQMMHNGSSLNVMMPAYAILAVVFGISVGRLLDWSEKRQEPATAQTLLLGAVFIQLCSGIYNPGAYKPTPEALTAAKTMQERLRGMDGDVLVFDHPNIAVLAGKPEHPDSIAMQETLRAMAPAEATALRADIAQQVCGGSIHAMYFDTLEDIRLFERTLHLRPDWHEHFSEPALAPGATPKSRPAWELLAHPTPVNCSE